MNIEVNTLGYSLFNIGYSLFNILNFFTLLLLTHMHTRDLEELVGAGIISADTAEQISRYYESKKDNSGNRFNILLGILGALLVGAGIVLVIAHNWDDLNKTIKTIFAFLPLVLGQGLCAFTLLKKSGSRVWRESTAVILFFAQAASISLVSQVYQVSGTLAGFIVTWLLLAAPLVYIMRSSVCSLLVIAAATWYVYVEGYSYSIFNSEQTIPWYYPGFILFLLPHYYQFAKNDRDSNFFHFHNWLLAISFTIGLGGFIFNDVPAQWGWITYMALFNLLYLVGSSTYFSRFTVITNPFLITGLLGSIFILIIWTNDWAWDISRSTGATFQIRPYQVIVTLFLLAITVLIIYKLTRDKKFAANPVRYSCFVLMACMLAGQGFAGLFIINCWVLLTGLYYIGKGNLRNHLGILNFGLLIIVALALFRFFDDNIPFIWRGIFFVIAGAGFFATNYLMLRKRKTVAQNNNL